MAAIGALPPITHPQAARIPPHDAMVLVRDQTALQQARDAVAAATGRRDAAVIADDRSQAALDGALVQRAQSGEKRAEARLQADQISSHAHTGVGTDIGARERRARENDDRAPGDGHVLSLEA